MSTQQNKVHAEGAFVEIALTNEQVAQALAEENRLELREDRCAFLEEVPDLPSSVS